MEPGVCGRAQDGQRERQLDQERRPLAALRLNSDIATDLAHDGEHDVEDRGSQATCDARAARVVAGAVRAVSVSGALA